MTEFDVQREHEIAVAFAPRLRELLDYAMYLEEPGAVFYMTRPMLTFVQAKAAHCEELLDAYGARNNSRWYYLREAVATLKNFGDAAYELIHIKHACAHYRLGDKEEDFSEATDHQIEFCSGVIRCALRKILIYARTLGLVMEQRPFANDFVENFRDMKLPRDRRPEGLDSVKNRIDALAINVLNTTEELRQFREISKKTVEDWDTLNFDFLCETKLRGLEVNMHVLRSLYDTYISDGKTESSDDELVSLRVSIAATLHLLRVATTSIHFYERHMRNRHFVPQDHGDCQTGCDIHVCHYIKAFYELILKYLAVYIYEFLNSARTVCFSLLRRYCVNKTVEVQVPPYIGFHVRPSALVAAIVLHYGCEVKMTLDDTDYDVYSSMTLIMANNYIDQKKRAYLMQTLQGMDLAALEASVKSGAVKAQDALRQVIYELSSREVVKIYQSSFDLSSFKVDVDLAFFNLREWTLRAVTYLTNNNRQAAILYKVMVKFTGPEQAVDDIAVLAEHSYGENDIGEDLELPPQLAYLKLGRKSRSGRTKQ